MTDQAQPDEAEKYMDLARQLSADVASLHDLWRQRDKLEQDQAQLQSQKDQQGDVLFQSEFDQQLEDDFSAIVQKLNKAQATQDACNRKAEAQEHALHAILPLATETFQRVFQALHQATYDLDYQSLLAFLHPEAVQEFKARGEQARLQESITTNLYLPTSSPSFNATPLETKLQELAFLCPRTFELRSLQIPSVPFFALQTQAPQAVHVQAGATIIRQWTKEEINQNRQKTMNQVIDCTNTLVDLAIQLLEFAEQIPGFQPPPFVLGPLPVEEQPQPAFQFVDSREETLKQEIRDQLTLRQQLRQAQGREDEPIQAFELDVIAHSLSLRTYGEKFSIQQVKEMIHHLFPETKFQPLNDLTPMRMGA
jgi:hypothetical protein